jgi:hypothetical protein
MSLDLLTPLSSIGVSRFNELVVANRTNQLNLKPTWGISNKRWDTDVSGTGAAAAETNGEFRLQSGTDTNGYAQVQTQQRGQYTAGATGQAGIGIRIPTLPASTASMIWGYTDQSNGFYFGADVGGLYIAYVIGGSETKVYQSSWNLDTLDGTGDSGLTLDVSDGAIYQVDFTWYGYGDIEYSVLLHDTNTNIVQKVTAHRLHIDGAIATYDPNQPLFFRVENGASNTTSYDLYVGGHQYSLLSGFPRSQVRHASEMVVTFTTATNTNWQPLVAFRKKATFNGRNNSVNVWLNSFSVAADNDMEVRITVNGVTSNLAWGTPTGWTSTETAVETKITGGTALTTSADGDPVDYTFVAANSVGQQASRGGNIHHDTNLQIGSSNEIILWVRRQSASGAMVVKQAVVGWTEEW